MKFAGAFAGLFCALMATGAAMAQVSDSDRQRPAPRHAEAPHADPAAGAAREGTDSARDRAESQHHVAGSSKVDNRPTSGAGAGSQAPLAAQGLGAARTNLRNLLEARARARGPTRQTRGGNASVSSLSQSGSRQAAGATPVHQSTSPTSRAAAAPMAPPASGNRMTSLHVMPGTGQSARVATSIKFPEHGGNSHTARIDGTQVRRGF